jgi:L-alanine-DL-glutamate epimerase-like enolase superfamily enzyme
VGWGEAGVAPHITGESMSQTRSNLQQVARNIVGHDIADYRQTCASFSSVLGGNPAALAAAEMAVLDCLSSSCGFPFWRLSGSRAARCSTDITVVLGTPRDARAIAKRFFRRGFRSFKIKVGADTAVDVARVLAVAESAPGSSLVLDGNEGYDASRALDLIRALRKQGIRPRLFEQPVPRADWDGLARLTRESDIPICADESVRTLSDAIYAVRSRAVKAINVKFAKSGVLAAAAIARIAKAAGMKVMIGAMLEGALSITAAAQFASGLGLFDFIDLDTTYFIDGPLGKSPYLDQGGRFDFRSAEPGIGVTPRDH